MDERDRHLPWVVSSKSEHTALLTEISFLTMIICTIIHPLKCEIYMVTSILPDFKVSEYLHILMAIMNKTTVQYMDNIKISFRRWGFTIAFSHHCLHPRGLNLWLQSQKTSNELEHSNNNVYV
jgi:hypothetical protein